MISYLHIKNIALIRDLSIELKNGLNILSGETGAGKSIIIDSINFVLGDRADRSLIRFGETTAQVEVVFDNIDNNAALMSSLTEFGIDCEDGTIIVSRLMTSDRSECRINGRIVNLSVLRIIVGSLVDVHSQNEHQSLMKTSNHILLLDAFDSKIEEIKTEYRALVKRYREICESIDGFMSEEERMRKLDLLSYQIKEIERINWYDEAEEENLKAERSKYYNSQKIRDAVSAAKQALEDDLGGISSIKNALSELRGATRYDQSLNDTYDRLESLAIEAEDIADTLGSALEDSGENINIEAIENRLTAIKMLKKKYGDTIADIDDFYKQAKAEEERLNDAERQLKELHKTRLSIESRILDKVFALHQIREKISEKFSKAITSNLNELGMKNSRFAVKIDYPESALLDNLNYNGADTLEFMLSPNIGEPLKPLSKIASGGEMSRFMLALKNIISEVDGIGTLIFDEIDTGISGSIAKVVACKLFDIARNRQVIAITHLPQLASMADVNYLIEKRVVDDKTLTFVEELKDEKVYTEIMRLTGAVENSEIGRSGAIELKEWANNYKNNSN